MMSAEMVRPFDSFAAVYKTLVWAGYYKLLKEPKSKLKRICHQAYRPFAFLIALVFNIQHIIFIIQTRDNLNDLFDCLMLEIPQLNLVVKFVTLNLQSGKIDKINHSLKNPIFAAHSKKDEELLLKNTKNMHRLSMVINTAVTICAVIWPCSYFVKRYHDTTAVVPSYVPFDTDSWPGFTCSVILEVIPLLGIGYGHMALDCVVATYYAQAEVQLKIIKHNLEHLFDTKNTIQYSFTRSYRNRNVFDEHLNENFLHCVKRYDKLAWYTKEVADVFNISTSFQFFTSSLTICMVIYRMSSTDVLSVPFMFFMVLLMLLLTQVFLYCYYGNLVQHESQSVNNSLYLSHWLSSSPRFRRLLLIAMVRWSRSLTPRVIGIIPLKLTTFFSIVRSAYSLYAVLRTKQD